MQKVLIVGEHDGKVLNPATAKCVTCAGGIPDVEITIALLGADTAAVAAQAAAIAGVKTVLRVDRPENAHPLAALFGVPQVSDLMAVEGAYRFKRPTYAGNAIVTVEADPARKLIATVRVASFEAAKTGGSASIESKSINAALPSHTRYVGAKTGSTDRPDLQTAKRVVSGGRALGSAENFKLLFSLADKIGAAVGASRAAVDAGYAPNEMQVGQTGKIISPDIYIAIGISGAIQHLTGIKDARTIVAINKDGEAPIFEVADLGLVGDLFQIVPELTRLIGA